MTDPISVLDYATLLDPPVWEGDGEDPLVPLAFLLVVLSRPRVAVHLGEPNGAWYPAYCQALSRATGTVALGLMDEGQRQDPAMTPLLQLLERDFPKTSKLFPDADSLFASRASAAGGASLLHIDLSKAELDQRAVSFLSPRSVVIASGLAAAAEDRRRRWEAITKGKLSWKLADGVSIVAWGPSPPPRVGALLRRPPSDLAEIESLVRAISASRAAKKGSERPPGEIDREIADKAFEFFSSRLTREAEIRRVSRAIGARLFPKGTRRGRLVRLLIRWRYKLGLTQPTVRPIHLSASASAWREIASKLRRSLELWLHRLGTPISTRKHSRRLKLVHRSSGGQPKVSVVIPVHNQELITRQCLASLYATTRVPFEVVIVDNGSEPATKSWIKHLSETVPNVRWVDNPTNQGYARAVNQGVSVSSAPYLLISNNDIVFTEGSIDLLVARMDGSTDIGILSPVTNYVGEDLQRDEDSVTIASKNAEKHGSIARRREPGLRDADRLVFFCVLVRRELYDQLGGLSEDYGIGNFEDDDFCLRAKLAGSRLAVVPQSFVYHHGSRSWGTKSNYRDWFVKNRQVFFKKVARYALAAPSRKRDRIDPPAVSVIVRTKDRLPDLRECLTSLANQTIDDFEVVVVNDGVASVSTVTEDFKEHLKINLIENEQSVGRTAALNIGVRASRGEWITYLDDDDIVYPMHLELLATHAGSSPVRFSLVNLALIHVEAGEQRLLTNGAYNNFEFDRDELMVENHIPIMSLMHSRRCIEEVGGFEESFDVLEDLDFIMRLVRKYDFERVPRYTAEYRFRVGDKLFNTITQRRKEAFVAILRIYVRNPDIPPHLRRRRETLLAAFSHHVKELEKIQSTETDDDKRYIAVAAEVLNIDIAELLASRAD